MRLIVKVQRPIVTSAPVPMVLIYNKDRSLMCEWPLDAPHLLEWFDLDDKDDPTCAVLKIYMHASYNVRTGVVTLLGLAPEQDW